MSIFVSSKISHSEFSRSINATSIDDRYVVVSSHLRRESTVLSLTVMCIHQVLLAYYRGAAATRFHLRTPANKRSWINARCGPSLNGFTRVYRGVIVCSNNSLRVDAPGRRGRTYQTPALFAPSHLFPDGWTATCSVEKRDAILSGRPKSMLLRDAVNDEKRMALGEEKSLRSYRGERGRDSSPDEWRWCPARHGNAPRPSWRDGIINYYQANSSRRAWPRTNERRARGGACSCTCVRWADARTTGYELAQLQLASLASRLSHWYRL